MFQSCFCCFSFSFQLQWKCQKNLHLCLFFTCRHANELMENSSRIEGYMAIWFISGTSTCPKNVQCCRTPTCPKKCRIAVAYKRDNRIWIRVDCQHSQEMRWWGYRCLSLNKLVMENTVWEFCASPTFILAGFVDDDQSHTATSFSFYVIFTYKNAIIYNMIYKPDHWEIHYRHDMVNQGCFKNFTISRGKFLPPSLRAL